MPGTVYAGVFPIAPTTFDDNGELDLESQTARDRLHDRRRRQRHLHPGQLLRAVRDHRRRARAADDR